MVNTATRPEGAEAPSPGQSPWVNQQSAMRPVRAKAFKNPPFNQHFNTQKTYKPEKKSKKRTKDVNVKCKDDAFWDDYDNNYNANRAITITNKKINTPCLLKKLQKAVVFSEFIYTFANKYLDIKKQKHQKMKKSKKTLRQIIALMTIAFTTISLTACGGSDDGGDKDDLITASEYLPGKEWTIGNETYSFYKNHLLVCESSANVTTGGLTSQAYLYFGTWQLDGNQLTAAITSSTQPNFDASKFFHGTYSNVHTEKDTSGGTISSDKPGSITITEPKPYIVGTGTDGKSCYIYYHKNMTEDKTDETIHDGALHGTWYNKVQLTDTKNGTMKTYEAKMIFNADGTVQFVIGDVIDFTTTYETKNGTVTLGSYLLKDNPASFIYLQYGPVVSLYDVSQTRYTCDRWYNTPQ